MKFFLTVIFVFASVVAQSQSKSAYREEVERYISVLDLLIENDGRQEQIMVKVADGRIEQSDGKRGGFTVRTITKNDSICKIAYTGGIDYYLKKTYYFKDAKPVFASLEVLKNAQPVYRQWEILRDDKKVSGKVETDNLSSDEKYVVDFSLVDDAKILFSEEKEKL